MATMAAVLAKTVRSVMCLAVLTSLTACLPERPLPTPPLLNLVTGCFSATTAMGEPYLYVACLPKKALESLKTNNPQGSLARAVVSAEASYAEELRAHPTEPRPPMLNLLTLCITEPSGSWNFLKQKSCISRPDNQSLFVTTVQLRIDVVVSAYFKQLESDLKSFAPRRPNYVTPPDVALPFILI